MNTQSKITSASIVAGMDDAMLAATLKKHAGNEALKGSLLREEILEAARRLAKGEPRDEIFPKPVRLLWG